jgi:hypothetical protein
MAKITKAERAILAKQLSNEIEALLPKFRAGRPDLGIHDLLELATEEAIRVARAGVAAARPADPLEAEFCEIIMSKFFFLGGFKFSRKEYAEKLKELQEKKVGEEADELGEDFSEWERDGDAEDLAGTGGAGRYFFQFRDDVPTVVEITHGTDSHSIFLQKVTSSHLMLPFLDFVNKVNTQREMSTEKDLATLTPSAVFKKYFDVDNLSRFQLLSKEPAPISWDPTELAYLHLDRRHIRPRGQQDETPPPAWSEFLDRIEDEEQRGIFCSFIWSIFYPEDKGRQVLWVSGAGMDGKSKVFETISSFLGPVAASITGFREEDRFSKISAVAGKRLILDADCRHPSILNGEFAHKVTGGDMMSLEIKYGGVVSVKPQAKMVFLSNYDPQISPTNNETSRLLYVRVTTPHSLTGEQDFEWPKRLARSFWAFLRYCRRVYMGKSCAKGIRQTELPSCVIDEKFLTARDAFFEKFEVVTSERSYVPWADVRSVVTTVARGKKAELENKHYRQLQRYLVEDCGCKFSCGAFLNVRRKSALATESMEDVSPATGGAAISGEALRAKVLELLREKFVPGREEDARSIPHTAVKLCRELKDSGYEIPLNEQSGVRDMVKDFFVGELGGFIRGAVVSRVKNRPAPMISIEDLAAADLL